MSFLAFHPLTFGIAREASRATAAQVFQHADHTAFHDRQEHFAAIAPHAGGLGYGGPKDVTPELDLWVKQLAPLPIRIVHGAQDNVVPSERSERMFQMLKASGSLQVELRILAGKDHGIVSALVDEELYTWLLKHSSQENKATKP